MKNNVIKVDFTAKQKRKSKFKKLFSSILKKITEFFYTSKKEHKNHGKNKSIL